MSRCNSLRRNSPPQSLVRPWKRILEKRFSYVEPLEFYEDLVPDMDASRAAPRLRGLAELCLVLLNSNEFLYVY